ncbi:MAG: glycosyltransferase family 2 protein [Vicinamibacterales bacterium]
MPARITAIVATRDRERHLTACLDSLAGQALPSHIFSILIVDNGSRDGTAGIAAAFAARHPDARVVQEPRPGRSRALNRALHEAATPYVAFLDDDAVAEPEWLARMLDAFESHEPVPAAAGGLVLPRFEAPPPAWVDEADYRHADYGAARVLDRATAEIGLVGGNMAVDRAVAIAVGGFDETLGHAGRRVRYGEDTEFCWRLLARGLPIYYDPAIRVHHVVRAETLTRRAWLRRWYAHGHAVSRVSGARRSTVLGELAPRIARWPARVVGGRPGTGPRGGQDAGSGDAARGGSQAMRRAAGVAFAWGRLAGARGARLDDDPMSLRARALRRALQRPALGPVLRHHFAGDVSRVITRLGLRDARVMGPAEFEPRLPRLVPIAEGYRARSVATLDAVVLRQDGLTFLDGGLLGDVRRRLHCNHLNPAYALFSRRLPALPPGPGVDRLLARIDELAEVGAGGRAVHEPDPVDLAAARAAGDVRRAALVTTWNRPGALRRALPQVAGLGVHVLVVDDGSNAEARALNQAIAEEAGAAYLLLPANLGLPTAINIGIAALLADPQVQWISYFQDDVDVRPDLLARLAAVEDAAERPVLTGYDADEHPATGEETIGGERVRWKRSSAGVHLHAHASYWSAVLPVPSPYVGAPKPGRGPSLEDWWLVNHAPQSLGRRGGQVACLPGLVRTFLWHRDDSTWDNGNLPDPPI